MRMKLGNLLLLWFLTILVGGAIALAGWGLAFAFSYNVFVPWLGCVPAEYTRLAAFISAFVFDGVGVFLIIAALAVSGLGIAAVVRALRKRS